LKGDTTAKGKEKPGAVSVYLGATINKHQIMPQKTSRIYFVPRTSEITLQFSSQMP